MTAYMPKAKTVEWETPQKLFDELNIEFHFTLDVCATVDNAKCEKYYTKIQDGLKPEVGRYLLDESPLWNSYKPMG